MIGFKLDKMKSMFFFDKAGNANPILRAVDAATRRVLSEFGAFVRRTAKASIRKRKRPSEPGAPPSSHTGLLKNFIYFGYDPAQQSVVIGPTRLNMVSFSPGMNPTRGTIPENLEYGGSSFVVEEWIGNGWRRVDLRRRGAVSDVGALRGTTRTNVFNRRPIRKREVRVAARPYMRPAEKKELPKFPALWRDSVKAA